MWRPLSGLAAWQSVPALGARSLAHREGMTKEWPKNRPTTRARFLQTRRTIMKRSAIVTVFSFVLLSLGLAGCPKKPAEGPMEKAGKKVDNAAEDTKDKAEEVKEDVKEGVKK